MKPVNRNIICSIKEVVQMRSNERHLRTFWTRKRLNYLFVSIRNGELYKNHLIIFYGSFQIWKNTKLHSFKNSFCLTDGSNQCLRFAISFSLFVKIRGAC